MIGRIKLSYSSDQPLLCAIDKHLRQLPALFENEQLLLEEVLAIITLLKKETALLSIEIAIDIAAFSTATTPLSNQPLPKELLSPREKEVLRMMFDGLTNKEIAQNLFISYETVKTHRKNILHKTGSKNTAALTKNLNPAMIEELKK